MAANGKATPLVEQQVTNDAEVIVLATAPYVAEISVRGTAPILFHRYSCDDVEEKSNSAKGSKTRNSDNVESYVYRCPDGAIGIPGVYLKGSICDPRNGAAKYRQDPRSPRKSALDLFKAGVIPLSILVPVRSANGDGKPASDWDYLDRQRVSIQRNSITRLRPAFLAGWEATFELQVLTPEYIPPSLLLDVLSDAGRLVGVGDFRPTYGRFQVTRFEVLL